MTQEDFLKTITELNVSLYRRKKDQYGDSQFSVVNSHAKPEADFYLFDQWVSGGQSGGSCWDDGDDDPHHSIEAEPESDLVGLDRVLEAVAPNLSFLAYRRLEREVIERGEYTENEYYGNYTEYGFKAVQLGKLYEWLKNQEGDVAGGAAGKRQDASRQRVGKGRR